MTSKGPYPDILFHFTDRSGLRGVVADGFRLSYARERIEARNRKREFAVPIVSFCDLRLSELPFHMRKYGRFGIGMRKSWAMTAGLNPVAYANKDGEFMNALFGGLEAYYEQVMGPYSTLPASATSDYMNLLNTLRYIKNYEGPLVRGTKKARQYRFADEREWRYVLQLNAPSDLWPFVPIEKIGTVEQKQQFNQMLLGRELNFQASDVAYVIVPNEANIAPIRKHIKSLAGRYGAAGVEHMSARILTAAQIEADM